MALTLTYTDSYLKSLMTEERETRALADVDRIATFADEWRAKLGVLRGYVLTCLESNAEAEDVFSVKLSQYRKEFDTSGRNCWRRRTACQRSMRSCSGWMRRFGKPCW